jgi:cytochrome c5
MGAFFYTFVTNHQKMKLRYLFIPAIILLLNSCSPKIVAMQPSDPVVPQMPSPPKAVNTERLAEGKSMYENNCAKCHKLFSPLDHTQTEWVPILNRMQKKAHLDDAQMALISEYVNSLATP